MAKRERQAVVRLPAAVERKLEELGVDRSAYLDAVWNLVARTSREQADRLVALRAEILAEVEAQQALNDAAAEVLRQARQAYATIRDEYCKVRAEAVAMSAVVGRARREAARIGGVN